MACLGKPLSLEQQTLICLALERLTQKQKFVLGSIGSVQGSATFVVKTLAKRMDCAESTVWNSVRSLRRARLVELDSITLTLAGKLIVEKLNGGE